MSFSTRLIATAAAALALGVGGLALAQQSTNAAPANTASGQHRHHGGADPAQLANRLDQVKVALQITPTQEVAWQNYTQVLLSQAQALQTQRAAWQAEHQGTDATATTSTDQTARKAAMKQQFEANRAQREAARKALFGTLSPEQQTLAKQQLSWRHGRGHDHGDRSAMRHQEG